MLGGNAIRNGGFRIDLVYTSAIRGTGADTRDRQHGHRTQLILATIGEGQNRTTTLQDHEAIALIQDHALTSRHIAGVLADNCRTINTGHSGDRRLIGSQRQSHAA